MTIRSERTAWLGQQQRKFPAADFAWTADLPMQFVNHLEAMRAYEAGLDSAAVMLSYSACEIRLIDSLVNMQRLNRFATGGDVSALREFWTTDNEAGRRMRSNMEQVFAASRRAGIWYEPDLCSEIQTLSDHRNDVTHWRPWGDLAERQTDDPIGLHRISPSPLADPALRHAYAQQGILTVLRLWAAPTTTTSGPIPEDFVPPPLPIPPT